jgi:hypothetical protein
MNCPICKIGTVAIQKVATLEGSDCESYTGRELIQGTSEFCGMSYGRESALAIYFECCNGDKFRHVYQPRKGELEVITDKAGK